MELELTDKLDMFLAIGFVTEFLVADATFKWANPLVWQTHQ